MTITTRRLLFLVTAVALLISTAACSPPFLWPLSKSATQADTINSPFGPRIRNSKGTYEFHEGIDLAATAGDKVFAVAAGTIDRLTDANGCYVDTANATGVPGCFPAFSGGGRIVEIDHGTFAGVRVFSLYFHLSRHIDNLKKGDQVAAGAQIGEVGQTGNASYPHLHFEIRRGTSNREDAENPLGELTPSVADTASTIAQAHLVTLSGKPVVEATIEAATDDLNLNQVAVEVRDASTQLVPQSASTTVNFNDRINCGSSASDTMNGITLTPETFKGGTLVYRLTVKFASLTLPSGGTFRITATDESNLVSQSGWIAIP